MLSSKEMPLSQSQRSINNRKGAYIDIGCTTRYGTSVKLENDPYPPSLRNRRRRGGTRVSLPKSQEEMLGYHVAAMALANSSVILPASV